MSNLLFYFYIFIPLALIAVIVAFIFLNQYKKKFQLQKALDLVLFEITFPHEKLEEKNFKELIGVMEQFYKAMVATKSYFVLEVGLPMIGKEITFYGAVDKANSQLFEKSVQGLFPQAQLSLKESDYNIFKPGGSSLGSVAQLKTSPVLPLRTYDKFESDPLQPVINAFSKLKEDGEGAALQIIISPADDNLIKKIKMIIGRLHGGESLSSVLKGENLGKAFLKETGQIITGSSSDKNKKEEKTLKPAESEVLKLLESKASRQMTKVNLRLIASSESREKSEEILKELESAFYQFGEAQGNSFQFKKSQGRSLKNLFYNFSFRIPEEKEEMILNTAELASVFHFPTGISSASAPQLKFIKTKEAPPPLNLPKDGLLIGQNTYRGEISGVYLKDIDRRRHLYVIGQTGTGKTTLLKNMIIQDIEAGRGVCFIDPHGSDLEDILSRIPQARAEDVIYFNPGDLSRPMGMNMLEYDSRYPEQKTFIINELLGIFNKLFDMKTAGGPMFEQYFRNAVMLVMDDPSSGNTLFEVSRILSDKNFREMKLGVSNNPIVKSFWKEVAEKAGGEASLQNMVPYITSKFDNFLSNEIMRPIISQEKSAFNFREVMDSGKILLINLSKGRLGDINSSLLGLIMVGKMLMASLSRVDIPEDQRKDFYLYIDEFQNVTTDSISTILSEARKYKLNLIVAHQFIGQLDEAIKKAVFGNVGSMACFRIGTEDAHFLEKQFEPVFNAGDLINIDNFYAYLKILIDGQTSRPFSMNISNFNKGEATFAEEIKKLSSMKYGRPREEVEAEVMKKYGIS